MKYLFILITLISLNSFAKDKVSYDGLIYHTPCKESFKPDTLSKHLYQYKYSKSHYAAGYCEATL
jgi:hypothetical protein